jgi:Arc/MetJ-type ribon-helix-helix transcriptional regulator
LHLSIKVSGYDQNRSEAIKQSIVALLEREEIDDVMLPLIDFGDIIASRSNDEVIISRAYEWVPEVQSMLSKEVEEANGAPCNVEFVGEYIDEFE